jgi:hypothetical protein
MHRLSDSQRRLREHVVLDVAHIARLLHVANRRVIRHTDTALAQVSEDTAVGSLEINSEWLRGAGDGGGESASAEDGAF